jgi:hypothetical protein
MELKEFISESIKQITDGLVEGHQYIKGKSPRSDGVGNGYKKIHFDIGVQSSEGDKADVGAKITVAQVFQIGGKTESNSSIINTNRIQFDVQISINHE